jgi:hypothetical protein
MTYKDQFESAEKTGKIRDEEMQFLLLDVEHPEVVGKVLGSRSITFKKIGKETKIVMLDTDQGEVSLIAGTVALNALTREDMKGKIVRIRYEGLITPEGGGQPYHDYTIQSIKS